MKKETQYTNCLKIYLILKETEEKYKTISIQRELSISELEVFQKKVAVAKENNKAHTDSEIYYVVRGTPNNYEIKTITTRKEKQKRE